MKNSKFSRRKFLKKTGLALAALSALPVRPAWAEQLLANKSLLDNQSAGASYPIAAKVLTTLERTVIPVAVPAASPKPLPNEVSQYSQYGYGAWQTGSGLAFQKRLDLMPPAYSSSSVKNAATLLRFFTMTDIHITDMQSPAQTIYFGLKGQPGMSSAYSPVILYTTHVLDAAVQTVNALHKKAAIDFGLFLGDAINNSQFNELRWYIDILDGKHINPNSDPESVAPAEYLRPFQAAGLDKSIPWYQVRGNHDHFWSGVFAPNDYLKQTLVGESILNIDEQITSDKILDTRGYYMGVVDGSTPYGDVIKAGPQADFATPPTVAANPDRRHIAKNDWIAQFFNTASEPVGHGFPRDSALTGLANYTFEPKANLPIRVIVLDDTENDDTAFGTRANGASGALDEERFAWLVKELDKGQADGKLMIIAAHVPIGIGPMWDTASSPSETTLIAKLHTYPNLILWVAGHRHYNTVTALPSPDASRPELGFWEVETASLRDFPQQFRIFDIVRNSDNSLSILAANVDPAVTPGSPAAISRAYSIAANEIFAGAPPYSPSGAYNAELVIQLSAEMQAVIKNCGTPIHG
ncbi:MAG: TIGR03768 family metallophosphoesterase [Sporomusaceae bacterium]|nr:TIGR03768 family metallophosphoesterase [Sporomusaceae bacterium]